MTELEYVLSRFQEAFHPFLGRKIILHGSREYAKAIIEEFDQVFHFQGVVSFDSIESEMFSGVPVFPQEDIRVHQPDLIILTERVKYAEAAYCSLRQVCRKNGISILNMYGLDEIQLHREAEMPAPESLKDWKELCRPYDRVVFEVMDTLICFTHTREKPMAREDFLTLIAWLRGQGKSVGFSLRKSFSEETQIRLLRTFELVNDDGELIRREGEDLSFRTLSETHQNEKILYIGNGLVNEFILPRCYGIDTRRVVERWNISGWVSEKKEVIRKPFLANQRRLIEIEIQNHTYISFDVFDTLLIRKTLYPSDVFELTEFRAGKAGIEVNDFALERKLAEQESTYADIDTIYEYLQDWYGWSKETAKQVKEIELGVERDVLAPRSEVVDLLNYALKEGKHVVLTSDMYLPEAVLRSLLETNGIVGFDRLLVSCDFKKAKTTGLYEELIALCGTQEKILHIGDDAVTDGYACEAANIKSVIVPSALQLARERGWTACIRSALTLMERCFVGMVISQLFRDPFQNPNLSERSKKERPWRYGTGAVGPFAAGHMTWLLVKLQENDFDGVLFLARDGYLPVRIYKRLMENRTLPMPVYYYANRHSAFLCRADSEDQTDYIIDMGRQFGLSATEILKRVYHLPERAVLPQDKDDSIKEYIARHMSAIREVASKSREGYRRYSENCGMRSGGNYAVVDFVSVGTIQDHLEQFLPYHLKGFYYGSYKQTTKGNCDIEFYLHGSNQAFLNSYIEMEGFFTSPEPPQDCVREDGTVIFAEEVRSRQELQEFRLVFEAALYFAEDFFQLFYREGETISAAVVEEMYAAEGYHWVQQRAYDDWMQVPIYSREETTKD